MAHFGVDYRVISGQRWTSGFLLLFEDSSRVRLCLCFFQLQFNLEHFSVSGEDAWLSVVLC